MITNGYITLTKDIFISAAEVMDKYPNIPFKAALLHGFVESGKYKIGYSGALCDFLYHQVNEDNHTYRYPNSPETVLLLLFLGEIVGDEGIRYRCWY